MTRFRILQASDLHLAVKPYQYGLPDSWWDVMHFRCPPTLVSSQDPDLQKAFALFAPSLPPMALTTMSSSSRGPSRPQARCRTSASRSLSSLPSPLPPGVPRPAPSL